MVLLLRNPQGLESISMQTLCFRKEYEMKANIKGEMYYIQLTCIIADIYIKCG